MIRFINYLVSTSTRAGRVVIKTKEGQRHELGTTRSLVTLTLLLSAGEQLVHLLEFFVTFHQNLPSIVFMGFLALNVLRLRLSRPAIRPLM